MSLFASIVNLSFKINTINSWVLSWMFVQEQDYRCICGLVLLAVALIGTIMIIHEEIVEK